MCRMKQSNRILANTIAQYAKIIIGVIIALYSTKVVLGALGQEEFGLFSLIGSVLAFLTFLNTSLTRSIQRYLSYYMGRKDVLLQKKVLFSSVFLHLVISLIICVIAILLETVLFNGVLNIENNKIESARVLYRLMVLNIFFVMNVVPFNAVFVSHENIVFTSFVYIVLAILKLVAALLLQFFSGDLLIVYGQFIVLISILEIILYVIAARFKYAECRHFFSIKLFEYKFVKNIVSFSWWNAYGSLCIIGRNQGYAFIINKFLGIVVNASYGIATQVSGQITNMVYSVSNAISPVIMRYEGAGDRNKMIYFSRIASKISFILFVLFAVPAVAEINYLLKWWLEDIPKYTIPFVVFIIVASLCDSIAVGFRTGIQAIGEIKLFSILVYSTKLLVIPIASYLLYKDLNPSLIFIPYVILELIGSLITIALFCKETMLSFKKEMILMAKQFIPCIVVPAIVSFGIVYLVDSSWYRVLITFTLSFVSTSFVVYKRALNKQEQNYIKRFKGIFVSHLHRSR